MDAEKKLNSLFEQVESLKSKKAKEKAETTTEVESTKAELETLREALVRAVNSKDAKSVTKVANEVSAKETILEVMEAKLNSLSNKSYMTAEEYSVLKRSCREAMREFEYECLQTIAGIVPDLRAVLDKYSSLSALASDTIYEAGVDLCKEDNRTEEKRVMMAQIESRIEAEKLPFMEVANIEKMVE